MNVDSGAPHFAYLHGRTVLRIFFPRISKKVYSLNLAPCHLNRHALPRLSHITLSPVCTHTAYGHAHTQRTRADLPCLYVQAGVGFLHVFGAGQWPSICISDQYARSRETAAHSASVETAQRNAHWARPCASGFARVFWAHVRGCVCWVGGFAWHWLDAHAVRACVLDCADCPGSSGTHSGPVRACFLGTCAWLCVLGGGLCVALASTRMLCFFCVPCSSGTHCCPWWLFCRPRGWFYGRDATVAVQVVVQR